MAHTRVHELAKEFHVDSKLILDKLKDLGHFVKSASSKVPHDAEMHLRRGVHVAELAGLTAEQWMAKRRIGGPLPSRPHSSGRRRPVPAPRPKRTSWTGTHLAPVENVWRQVGLGDDGEPLARFLLEHGFLPEDLKVPIRGTRAVNRFRSGEASWHVLAVELKEARNAVEVKRELPDTKQVRRDRPA